MNDLDQLAEIVGPPPPTGGKILFCQKCVVSRTFDIPKGAETVLCPHCNEPIAIQDGFSAPLHAA